MSRSRRTLIALVSLLLIATAAWLGLRSSADRIAEYALAPRDTKVVPARFTAQTYANPKLWLARPDIGKGAALWLPQGAAPAAQPVRVALFFVYPTTALERGNWNVSLDDVNANWRAAVFLRGLASPFADAEQLWIPRYRQATLGAILATDPRGAAALDLAYQDVAAAFDAFVAAIPSDLPIVLAGHSQGSFHLRRLLSERIASQPIQRRIAAAYLPGWPLSLEHDVPFLGLPACTAPDQSGCLLSWVSFGNPAQTEMMASVFARQPGIDHKPLQASNFLCSYPLAREGEASLTRAQNLGTLIPSANLNEGRLVAGVTGARCRADGILLLDGAPSLGPFVLFGNNYHVYDIPLFWANIRADMAARVLAWHRPAA